ncbi:MAG: putative DNA binding domain-containing protein [Clostridiales bacterium]|jgi:ATP-dependent DNA helicase RecG|nr:putative DNA binding domain-containing protein [Clostridiales bacterium]MDR2712645.1 putative DNA binding domain-containing protein [Clostridiales bacterium]
MQEADLIALAKRIQRIQCETQTIEVKAAQGGCPTKLYGTLSGFSNQDDGGIILFGLDEKEKFKLVGVYDAQDLQKKVTEQCKQMEPQVRPLFTVAEMDGEMIVSAEIPAVDISERPVYYRGVGKIKGSYVRVCESDEPISEYEIYSYEAFRKQVQDDLRRVEKAKLSLFDEVKFNNYLAAVKRERKNLAESVPDDEIMELMGVTAEGVPTIAGIMSFSKYPQGYFPQLCITAVSLPGLLMGDLGDDDERFIDNQRITGSIPDMIEPAVDFVRRNSRNKTIIDDDGKRRDKLEYPPKAVREAVLNALVHRDYSVHSQNIPVRIEMYRDRMEIINSGGLYGKITIDSLGKVRPDTRNSALANILELLDVTENRYSGIPTIRSECAKAGIPAPVFEVRRGEFKVIFKNNIFQAENKRSRETLQKELLEFCNIPKTREEITTFTGFSRTHTMNGVIQPLVNAGLLRLTLPDKPKSSKQTYASRQ